MDLSSGRGGLTGEKEVDEDVEEEGVERDGDDEADGYGDNAEFFDVLVAVDAGCEVVGDRFVEGGDAAAGGHNDDADEEPAHTKFI